MNLLYAIAFSAGILNGAMAQYEPIIITEIDYPSMWTLTRTYSTGRSS
jgi:hypothetical protein